MTLLRCPSNLYSVFALIGLIFSSARAVEVALAGHVGAGLVQRLEEVKTVTVLDQLQHWGLLPVAQLEGQQFHEHVSLAFVNSSQVTMHPSAADQAAEQTSSLNGNHWGFSHEHPFWGATAITVMLHYLSFAAIIKAACMMSNVVFQVSPYSLVKGFDSKGDTGEVDAAPFVAIAFGGCQWCFYGLFAYLVTAKSGFLVLVYSNFLGAILGVYYVQTFHRNCHDVNMQGPFTAYMRVVCALVALQLGSMLILPRERALFFSGLVSSTCSVATSCSSLITVPKVIRTKDASSIPVPFVSAAMVSGILWIICGAILWDPWICLPNIVGIAACSVSLGLVLWYGRGCPDELDSSRGDISSHVTSPSARDRDSPRFQDATADEAPDDSADLVTDDQVMSTYGSCGETGGTF